MNENEIKRELRGKIELFYYTETDSTNKRAGEYARTAEKIKPTLFIARRQSAGRGRLGRAFLSDDGGIYMSLLMPSSNLNVMEITPKAAALAADVLDRSIGLEVGIKWVNDLYINGKKLAGILTEGAFDENGNLRYFIVGMGINVYKNASLTANCPIATTIEDALGKRVDINALAAELAMRIMEDLENSDCLQGYRDRCIVIGKRVTVLGYNESYPAMCLGVDDDYSLIVRRESDGEIIKISTGEVSIRL